METTSDTRLSQVVAGQSDGAIPYASALPRARRVIQLFFTGIALAVLSIACSFHLFLLMVWTRGGESASESQFGLNDVWQALIDGAHVLWYLATVVVFLMWIHRAHRNLSSLGADGLEFSPRGAVGWYFAPFLNLFKPYQVMREIYNASDPSSTNEPSVDWRYVNAPFVVKTWWALFLIMNVVNNAATRASYYADSPGAWQFVAGATMFAEVLSIAAMLAALSVVRSVTRRQESRAAALGLNV